MTPLGWMMMVVSITTVVALVSFCMFKVLSLPPLEAEDHVKGPLDIDTHDTSDAD